MNIAYNIDCMEYLKTVPDKFFSLACVDPPYGGGGTEWETRERSRFGGRFDRYHISRGDLAELDGGFL